MKISIAHVCILTKDLKTTEEFYTNGLGMKKKFDFHKDGKLYGFYLEMSDRQFIEVFEDPEAEHRKSSFLHLCLESDDLEGAKKRLNENGIETTEIKKGCDNTFQVWFKDPNGIDVEIHQYTEQSSQLTGVDCQVDW